MGQKLGIKGTENRNKLDLCEDFEILCIKRYHQQNNSQNVNKIFVDNKTAKVLISN